MTPKFEASPRGFRHGAQTYPCALGKGGLLPARDKREGDGASPIGLWPLRGLYYRADRGPRPETALPIFEITPDLGWCDDPAHGDYNRLVRLPHPARHEKLWRDDPVYDLIVTLGHNDDPPIAGMGSAIFLHVARPGYIATEGCVALGRDHLLAVLRDALPGDGLAILP